MLLIGLPVFVFQLTGSALTTSTVFVAELVPALIVGQLGGVLVDRWDRRRILIAASLLQAVLLLPLLAVDSADRLWIVYLVAAAQSGLARICSPATAALIPALVPRDELASANAMNAVGSSIARLVGSPLGGLAVQLLGLGGIVAVDAATFVVSALFVAAIRVPAAAGEAAGEQSRPERPRSERPHLVADWVDGLRTIVRRRHASGLPSRSAPRARSPRGCSSSCSSCSCSTCCARMVRRSGSSVASRRSAGSWRASGSACSTAG